MDKLRQPVRFRLGRRVNSDARHRVEHIQIGIAIAPLFFPAAAKQQKDAGGKRQNTGELFTDS